MSTGREQSPHVFKSIAMTGTNSIRLPQGLSAATHTRLSALPVLAPSAGQVLFHPGDAAAGFVLVLAGRIDVFLVGPSGREILLYSVAPGDTCVQTTLGIMGGGSYTAEGIAATDCQIVIVPAEVFHALVRDDPGFAAFVFRAFAARMQDMMHLLERVAFTRVESRLAQALLDLARNGEVHITQQDLASRIGSAREVVSRRLDAFARDGFVTTDRGVVRLTDVDALRRLAALAR